MEKYIISRASIVNKCNSDGLEHLIFTEKERPCKEAFLEEIIDKNGDKCSRFFINLCSIADVYRLGKKYNVDVLVTVNHGFPDYIALLLYDELLEN